MDQSNGNAAELRSTKKWTNLKKILERPGPFCHPSYTPSEETLEFLITTCKILVIGLAK